MGKDHAGDGCDDFAERSTLQPLLPRWNAQQTGLLSTGSSEEEETAQAMKFDPALVLEEFHHGENLLFREEQSPGTDPDGCICRRIIAKLVA